MNIDNSKRSGFKCHRKYFYEYIAGYSPDYGSTALRYGATWHAMKEGFYSTIAAKGWDRTEAVSNAIKYGKKAWEVESSQQTFIDDYRTLENCMLSFAMFTEHFSGDEGLLEVVEPEIPFKLKFNLTPAEENKYPVLSLTELYFTGKIDLEIILNGRYWIVEDKTTGQNLNIQSERLQRSAQLLGYTAAANVVFKEPPDGVLVTIHQLNAYKSKVTGLYGTPKVDFKRVPQIFSEGNLADWRESFLTTAEAIAISMSKEIWDKNFDACYDFGHCPFYKLCSQGRALGDEILTDFHTKEPWDVLKGKEPVEGEI